MKKTVIILLLLVPVFLFSQEWKREANSIFFGTGTNNYMGDLGGGKKDAAHFLGIRDFDYQSTRPTFQFGYRYRFAEYLTVKAFMSYAMLSGTDEASGSIGRRSRNLSFRSPVFEFGTQLEYFFIKESVIPRYNFSSIGSLRYLAAYFFFGFGGFYFDPQAQYEDGTWYSLRKLGTEGQYAKNPDGTQFSYISFYKPYEPLTTPEPYKPYASFISIGIGAKYNINRQWSVGVEISNRYTSTDYLDDAHDRYFNYSDFPELSYPEGVDPQVWHYFADRHLVADYENNTVGGPAEPYHSGKAGRGNPDYNDAYIFTLIHVYYTLKKNNRYHRPKFR